MKNRRSGTPFIEGFRSIRSAIFMAISILVLSAVVLVTAVSMRVTRRSIYENSVMYTRAIIQQINQSIDSYIDYMGNIASMVAGSKDAQEFLFSDDDGEMEDAQERLLSQFEMIVRGRDDISNLGLLSTNGRALINGGNKKVNPDLNIEGQQWYQDAVGQLGLAVLTSSHVQHVIRGERPWVITLSRGIRNLMGTVSREGVFFIDLNYSVISGLCEQNSFDDKGYVFILDADGNIVYHPQQQQLYNELQTENISLIMNMGSDMVRTDSGSQERLYTVSRSEKTGWTVVGCVKVEELLRSSRQAQSIYVITALVLVVIALLLSRRISRTITYPIQKLRDSMRKVQEGEFVEVDEEDCPDNEIGSLTQSFNAMTRRIEDLMAQNTHEQEEKRKSELRALQSQINPHFLYNTLDSIIWMAEGKKSEEVVLMTSALARLLRQSISNVDELVPIRQEMEYCRSYLTIQKMRYKDKLEFRIEADPEILGIPIIKLALQPLIENAIYHGLKYKDSRGLLLVRGYARGDDVALLVEDNGVGMDRDTLERISRGDRAGDHAGGVGVYNVRQRLQLYYGERCRLTFESRKNVGTRVTITIPKRQEASNEKI